ncbi:MAG: prepilin-type N-terminal cleavage/methylation domain-containing protein, partial [Alphaproteobacteria bacterium]|nr:prepilin-type N-terminal cleavage/methylation domain-containing protein [Alphaproteobacteria bacterium]
MPRLPRNRTPQSFNSSSHQRGFTLIELSIVMAIIGALVAGAMSAYKVVIVEKYLTTTNDRLKEIQEAMVRFKAGSTNGRLPCPAKMHLPPGDPAFGVEDVNIGGGDTCSTPSPTPALTDTVRVTNGASSSTPNTVRIGVIPVKTLGLSADHMTDSWGHRFFYAVSEKLADGSATYTPNSGAGAITLLDSAGTPIGPVANNTDFVIISTGKTGQGSITVAGNNFPAACPAATPEGENCDWGAPDAIFVDRTYSEAATPALHFDDYVRHTLDNTGGGGGGGGAMWIDDLLDGISDRATTRSNVFLGDGSGVLTTPGGVKGISNTAAGIDSLSANTDGSYNTAVGRDAL